MAKTPIETVEAKPDPVKEALDAAETALRALFSEHDALTKISAAKRHLSQS
jgi:hypothetical protein